MKLTPVSPHMLLLSLALLTLPATAAAEPTPPSESPAPIVQPDSLGSNDYGLE
ncbi:hypothetical protein [Deinococcus multiflagellatus]|uniref:Uncharacterized protein n=1 Tax=Deinococcus multiflagellatus TaxID=1656887 RepID=A0ABW1ZQ21_9DEIO|nr:hypothetical protein [Deinococcus multiflagellatus]MBZ9715556.1 hypothetical protein [Deinococcus multiflagellatus]